MSRSCNPNRTPILTLILLGLTGLSVVGCAEDALGPKAAPDGPVAVTSTADGESLDHVLVLPNGRRPGAQLLAAIEAAGGTVDRRHDEIGVLTVRGLTDAAADALDTRSDVEGIERDVLMQWIPPREEFELIELEGPTGAETDQSGAFFFDDWQWNMRQIQADDAWNVTPQGQGTLVCVLDTGIDPNHIDLASHVDLGKSVSFVASEPFVEDLNFHGTFVAALIASNGLGMASVAPDARLCAIKVLSSAGTGSFADAIAGILYAAEIRADVANMSLGAHILRSANAALVEALTRAVALAGFRGTLVVASAGNAGLNMDEFLGISHVPSMIRGVLSVGATAPVNQMDFDALASYTNYGVRGVDVMAPGGDLVSGGVLQDLILSACSSFVCSGTNVYVLASGTSFSAPHASGTAAVVESAQGGDQGPRQLTDCIRRGADDLGAPGIDGMYGSGRINVLNTVGIYGCGGVTYAAR